jgi:hypothetical protein
MAVGALAQTVDDVIDRIVELQPLAIAEVTPNTDATKQWHYRNDSLPYWSNRPGPLVLRQKGKIWLQNIVSWLYVAHVDVRNVRDSVNSQTPQDNAWLYQAETLQYFTNIRTTLAPDGYAEVANLAPEGLTITTPRGLDFAYNPQVNFEALYIEFQFIVPICLVST